MTSLRIKLAAVLAALELLLLGALFVLASFVGERGAGALLLAAPSGHGTLGLDPNGIEELWDSDFLITYESRRSAAVHALNSARSVDLIGTNSGYCAVMGYRMLTGGFFAESAQKEKRRHAVLNERAAFELFGSVNVIGQRFELDDKEWTVVGVMDDKDEDEANAYVPASVLGARVYSIMALLDGERVTKEYAKNELKRLGVYEDGYEFIVLGDEAAGYHLRFAIAWRSALCAALIVIIRIMCKKALTLLRALRDRARELYPKELFSGAKRELLKAPAVIALLAAASAALALLLSRILSLSLSLSELKLSADYFAGNDFVKVIVRVQEHIVLGSILFAAALAIGLTVGAALLFCVRGATNSRD